MKKQYMPAAILNKLSSYTGDRDILSFSGQDDPSLDFRNGNNFFDLTSEDVLAFQITNSNSAIRSMYLNPGIVRNLKGTIANGTFAAIDDTGSDTSLTFTAVSPTASATKLLAYTYKNATACLRWKYVSTNVSAQSNLTITVVEQDLVIDAAPVTKYLIDVYNPDAYHDQVQFAKLALHFDDQTQTAIQIAGDSTITFFLEIIFSFSLLF